MLHEFIQTTCYAILGDKERNARGFYLKWIGAFHFTRIQCKELKKEMSIMKNRAYFTLNLIKCAFLIPRWDDHL